MSCAIWPRTMPRRAFARLRNRDLRWIWTASALSNFGLLIYGIDAGWAMTEMSDPTEGVAQVQTALMPPLRDASRSAGAISDTNNRIRIRVAILVFVCLSAVMLTRTAGRTADPLAAPAPMFCVRNGQRLVRTGSAFFPGGAGAAGRPAACRGAQYRSATILWLASLRTAIGMRQRYSMMASTVPTS